MPDEWDPWLAAVEARVRADEQPITQRETPAPAAFPVSREWLTRAILAATDPLRVMGACDCSECAEALADAIIAYDG